MGVRKSEVEKAQTAVEKAQEQLDREKAMLTTLEEQATTADREYAEQQESAGQIPDDLDPANAEGLRNAIAAGSDSLGRAKEEAEWAWEAVRNQMRKVNEARRALIEAHADAEAKNVKAKERELAKHREKVQELLAPLRELEGVNYVPDNPFDRRHEGQLQVGVGRIERTVPVSERLERDLRIAQERERVLREYLRTGKLPMTGHGRNSWRHLSPKERPEVLYGPNAELPETDEPERPAVPLSEMKIGEPTR